ncbi:MAG: hypothetical protein ACFFBL_02360 [Promethearchaeota archaeon]
MNLAKQLGVVLVALLFVIASVPNAHAANYRSTMVVNFNPAFWDPPVGSNPIWVGTISGDIEGTMTFWATGPDPAKDLGYPPDGFPWQVHFFTEKWEIVTADGTIKGIDKGNTGYSNWKFRMNGEVTEASGIYENLVGHKVHMDGQIEWTPGKVFAEGVAIGPVLIN